MSEGDEGGGQTSKQGCGHATAAISAWSLFPHLLILVSSSYCFVCCSAFISFFSFSYLLLQIVKDLKVIKTPMEAVQKVLALPCIG